MYRKRGQNAKLARLHNRANAMKLITQAGNLSRKELADRIGLTKAAITKIAEELITLGLVTEGVRDADVNGMGRRPTPLSVDPGKFRIMTLHIGRRRLKSYLSDASANVLKKAERSSRMLLGTAGGVNKTLLEHVGSLMEEWGIHDRRFFAIAIASPGLIRTRDFGTGGSDRRYRQPYLWDSLHEYLAPRLGCPVFVENDANMMALGEQWFGVGKGCSHFVFYNIGEGIGAAPVIDDMLYRGHNTLVAEVGHVTVDKDGEQCTCGNRGCLELYAGFARLREKFLAIAPDRKPRSYETDLAELFRRYAKKDVACVELIHEHAKLLSLGAMSLANMFSPEKIIVGINDCDGVDLTPFVEQMRDDVSNRAFTAIGDGIDVEPSVLGMDSMYCGGTALVMSELLADTNWLSGKWEWGQGVL